MPEKTTRTLNPLHFEDLEPHRFEDMVRQLAYDFRTWQSIEATGRLGADEGIDIRATEVVGVEPGPGGEEEDDSAPAQETRPWVIQCKREKRIGPADMRKIVSEAIPRGSDPPYGFIVSAACDFSKKARDTFRLEASRRGVHETHAWGKAELEDMLFLPKNDHLLFAYFNISLQVRRRSLRTEVRSRLAMKRKLVGVLGPLTEQPYKKVFLRDPREQRYPKKDKVPDFLAFPRWRYATLLHHDPPDHLCFITGRYFAYVDDSGVKWDAMFAHNDEHAETEAAPVPMFGEASDRSLASRFWWAEYVPKENRALFLLLRTIHYDRILAVDEFGDIYHEPPHLLVEFSREHGPFDSGFLSTLDCGEGLLRKNVAPMPENRVVHFPEQFRGETP